MTQQATVLEKLIHHYEQSLMDLMALQEELRLLPMNASLENLIRSNVEIATLTKTALEIARLRLQRQQALDATQGSGIWIEGWKGS